MDASLSKILASFNEAFGQWNIRLEPETLAANPRGLIEQNGWLIRYELAAGPGETVHFDYFASHRMTNDTLVRIHSDGSQEMLGCSQEFFRADDPQAEQEYTEHNRKFYAEVQRRGLSQP